jgi:hypothetical protein
MPEQPLPADNALSPDAAILARNDKKYLIVLGSVVLILCVCVGLSALAGSLVLLPTSTPAVSIPTQASAFTLTPVTPVLRPSLTPLPVQKADSPSQTALVLTLTVQAGYSRTPEPPTPTNPRPTYTPGPEPEPTRVKVTFAAHTPGSECNPAYPTLCLKSRLSCHQIGISNFTVLPPDPFGYDNDDDGKGCDN